MKMVSQKGICEGFNYMFAVVMILSKEVFIVPGFLEDCFAVIAAIIKVVIFPLFEGWYDSHRNKGLNK